MKSFAMVHSTSLNPDATVAENFRPLEVSLESGLRFSEFAAQNHRYRRTIADLSCYKAIIGRNYAAVHAVNRLELLLCSPSQPSNMASIQRFLSLWTPGQTEHRGRVDSTKWAGCHNLSSTLLHFHVENVGWIFLYLDRGLGV